MMRADIEVIQAVLASFYVSLFAKEVTDQVAQTYLLSCVTDRVPADRVDDRKGPLSDEKCFATLSGIARGKAPGFDGLPMEILPSALGRVGEKIFWGF